MFTTAFEKQVKRRWTLFTIFCLSKMALQSSAFMSESYH